MKECGGDEDRHRARTEGGGRWTLGHSHLGFTGPSRSQCTPTVSWVLRGGAVQSCEHLQRVLWGRAPLSEGLVLGSMFCCCHLEIHSHFIFDLGFLSVVWWDTGACTWAEERSVSCTSPTACRVCKAPEHRVLVHLQEWEFSKSPALRKWGHWQLQETCSPFKLELRTHTEINET